MCTIMNHKDVCKNKLKILFFSVNRHQKKYFDTIVNMGDSGWVSIHKRELSLVFRSFYIPFSDLRVIYDVVRMRHKYNKNKNSITSQNKILSRSRSVYNFISSYFFMLKVKSFFLENKFLMVVLWNDMKWQQYIVKAVAKNLGVKTAFFENGAIPNTVTIDPKGVNYNNSVPRKTQYYCNRQDELANENNVRISTCEGYIFAPFQVDYDTQIISHSPWIADMDEFYCVLESLLITLPETIDIYIKEHPASSRSYQHLHHLNSRIKFVNDDSTSALISGAEMVITINSTVGLESIIQNKSVIVLGNAFYSIPGLCRKAKTRSELIALSKSIVIPDYHVKDAFLNYLKNSYYVEGDWHLPTAEHVANVERKLREYSGCNL